MRIAVAVAIVCLSLIGVAVADPAGVATKRMTSIPTQGLGSALQTFARERDLQVLYRTETVGSIQSPGATGELTINEALTQLLSGTGLTFQYLDEKTVTIVPLSSAAAAAAPLSDASFGASARRGEMAQQNQPVELRLAQAGADTSAAAAQSAGAAASQSSADSGKLQEIVVTARKRTERQIDVPIAITVLSGQQIEAMGIDNVVDAIAHAPGVAAFDQGGGISAVQIRGSSAQFGSNENGYYLDDVPFNGVTLPWYPDTRSFDLDRIEVLKGPQGTLFGEGSIGGTVRILTHKPEFNAWNFGIETAASTTDQGADGWGIKALVNVPLMDDKLAARFAVTDETLPGWIDHALTGQRDLNEQRIKTGRAKLRYAPTDRLNIDLSYWKFKAEAPGGFDFAFDDMTTAFALNIENEWDSASAAATYSFEGSELLYVFSDGNLMRPISGQLAPTLLYRGTVDIDLRTHELRWSSTGERNLAWTVGYYLRKAQRQDTTELTGLPEVRSMAANDSYSVYGEATLKLPNPAWALTVGLRYFNDEVDSADVLPAQNSLQDTFDDWSPRVSLSYSPAHDATIYVSAAHGFRSGQLQPIASYLLAQQSGVDLPVSVQPDSIWSYELV